MEANRLIGEISPYLLARAHDPVAWRPWGAEAFAWARETARPIFLSIGYGTCDACRRMARESFQDEAVARVLNERFVPVLVDRQERPDVDLVYMNAVQLLSGTGGWPLTLFLTPDGRPFYGGTYFPAQEKEGVPACRALVEEIAEFYRTRAEDAGRAADQLLAALRDFCDISPRGRPDTELTAHLLLAAFRNIAAAFDGEHGGFGGPPRFPPATLLEFLLRYYVATGEPHALNMVETTLERMARGGVFDPLGGGFFRYAMDASWRMPLVEKRLNDNALLAGAYLDAYRVTGKALYERVARQVLDWMQREMLGADGRFFAAQAPESRDGAAAGDDYYLWTPEEIRAVVGPDNAEVLLRYFGVGPTGNVEGSKSILTQPTSLEAIAQALGRDPADVEIAVAEGHEALFEIRQERRPPALDDLTIAGWNGLAIAAMARAAVTLGETPFRAAAQRCATFVLDRMRRPDGGLWHVFRGGVARVEGCLPDYAFVIRGLLALHKTTAEARWLDGAAALAAIMVERFWDEREGGFFYAERGESLLPVRLKDTFDSPEPASNAAAVFDLLRLAEVSGRADWRATAEATLKLFVPSMLRSSTGMGQMLSALECHLGRGPIIRSGLL